ncbi:hypothetical protein Leryth_004799 [Lithospermum erythrorhizon]|nr:hypothetical protein Leryth_004799 [Lithospermum erythrorhizon]
MNHHHPKPPPSTTTHLLWVSLTSTFIKLLLIPTYHSTDFEITVAAAFNHTLPLPQWYSGKMHSLDLDYPPFFAFFEYLLSLFASSIDPIFTNLNLGLNYQTTPTIIFHRATYNGFLLGLLLVSLSGLEEGRDLFGGFVFAVLICFKHLFAVAAPVYFVYLLRHYCRGGLVKGVGRLVIMGSAVVVVFVAAYGPFVYYGQSYPTCLLCIVKAWRKPQPRMITRWVAYAYTCGFLFGWHVHEKASLHFVIPLATIAMHSKEDAKHYLFLSIVSCYSLFPLLFEAQEYPIKVLLLLLHALLLWYGFSSYFTTSVTRNASSAVPGKDKSGVVGHTENTNQFIGWFGKCYLLGLVLVEVWGQVLHPIVFGSMLPFLPLMMISTYCAIGILYSWVWQLRYIISSD